jgi:hypothetical protein
MGGGGLTTGDPRPFVKRMHMLRCFRRLTADGTASYTVSWPECIRTRLTQVCCVLSCVALVKSVMLAFPGDEFGCGGITVLSKSEITAQKLVSPMKHVKGKVR